MLSHADLGLDGLVSTSTEPWLLVLCLCIQSIKLQADLLQFLLRT